LALSYVFRDKQFYFELGNIFVDGIITFVCCDAQPRIIDVNKIIRQTIGNKVEDGIYCDTQPSTYCLLGAWVLLDRLVDRLLNAASLSKIFS
jgi:hypothetical protein